MLTRLLGLETEYALRFTPAPGFVHPGSRVLYDAIIGAVRERVATVRPRALDTDETEFLANGGALSFEQMPYSTGKSGLVEAGTPEHSSPASVLLYQHAMDRLLADAAIEAEKRLIFQGTRGELRLLKNCRDVDGEVYGVQENLEVELASGPALWLWRAGWAALVPFVIAWIALIFLLALVLVLGSIPVAIPVYFGFRLVDKKTDGRAGDWWRAVQEGPGPKILRGVDLALNFVPAQLVTSLMWLCAFRDLRRDAVGFLVSRCLITGAGTLERDDTLGLSEKGTVISRVCRATIMPADRAIFDTGNLLTDAFSVAQLKLSPMFKLFEQRQRMQLGLADANLCHVAEYLKIGVTALVVDAVEAGALRPLYRPSRPIKALRQWMADPTAQVPVRRGLLSTRRTMSAFEMQRQVLDAVDAWVREHPAPAMEALDLLRLWRETLDLLDEEPGSLVGRLDWVTKRWLMRKAGANQPWAVRKKIDIRYHELDSGYWAELAAAGLCVRLTDDDEVLRAAQEPPDGSPAKVRARFVRDLRWSGEKVSMSWGGVKVGRGSSAKIYRFDDFR